MEVLMNTVTQNLTRLKIFTVLSFFAASALGTACHFAYGFFGQNILTAPFVPVNESTWEHLKLLFFPFLVLLAIGYFLGFAKKNTSHALNRSTKHAFLSCYLDGAAFGLLYGMTAIVVLFYTTNGILGIFIDWISIAIYFISMAYAHFIFYRYASMPYYNTFSYGKSRRPVPVFLPLLVILCIAVLFGIFTFYPPQIGLFYDTQRKLYGLPASLPQR